MVLVFYSTRVMKVSMNAMLRCQTRTELRFVHLFADKAFSYEILSISLNPVLFL